jgi:hypothetical protein
MRALNLVLVVTVLASSLVHGGEELAVPWAEQTVSICIPSHT